MPASAGRNADRQGEGDGSDRRPASWALKSPPQRRRADLRRLLHDDKAGALEMRDEAPGDDLGHDLVGVVDALAAFESQGESKRIRQVGGIGGGKLVGSHGARVTPSIEQNKNEQESHVGARPVSAGVRDSVRGAGP